MTIRIIGNNPDLPKDYSIDIHHVEKRDAAGIKFIRMCFVDMANAAGFGCYAYDFDEVFATVMRCGIFYLEDGDNSIVIKKIED